MHISFVSMVAGIVVVVTIVVVVRGIVVVVGSVVVVVGPALELEPLEIKVPTIARITTTPTAAPAINHLRFDNKPEELASPSDPDGSNGVVLGGGGGSVSPIGGDSGGTLESLGGVFFCHSPSYLLEYSLCGAVASQVTAADQRVIF